MSTYIKPFPPLPAQPPHTETPEDRLYAFYERLVREGIIVEANSLIHEFDPYDHHQLIEVRGAPLSQEIIESRR